MNKKALIKHQAKYLTYVLHALADNAKVMEEIKRFLPEADNFSLHPEQYDRPLDPPCIAAIDGVILKHAPERAGEDYSPVVLQHADMTNWMDTLTVTEHIDYQYAQFTTVLYWIAARHKVTVQIVQSALNAANWNTSWRLGKQPTAPLLTTDVVEMFSILQKKFGFAYYASHVIISSDE